MFEFVVKNTYSNIEIELNNYRAEKGEKKISTETVADYLSYCKEVCEVIASHSYGELGGPGKTLMFDETFLTTRKYHRGRVQETHTKVIFGIYCREDKQGVFFRTNGKSKEDLWPIVNKYCHKDTSFVNTDEARQYKKVDALFSDDTIHQTTNHSKGEFVELKNRTNTINPLENENKLLKKAIKSRQSDEAIDRDMAVFFYRRLRLDKIDRYDVGKKIATFLEDVVKVFPGCGKTGLEIKFWEVPTAESENISHLMPPKRKKPRLIDDDLLCDFKKDEDFVIEE